MAMKYLAFLAGAVAVHGAPMVPMDVDDDPAKDFDAEKIWMSTSNFKCRVNKVSLVTDQGQSPEIKDAFDPTVILNHFGKPQDLEWAHVSQHFFSDIDGRTEEKILATPGGDLGEFLLALSVFEDLSKTEVDVETAAGLLLQFIKSSTKVKFWFNTAEKEMKNLTTSLGCVNLKIVDPPLKFKKPILNNLIHPGNVGNRHFKNMLLDPAAYDTRQRTIETVLQAFHLVMWNKTDVTHHKLAYIMYQGNPTEKAFVNIESAQHCIDEGLAPLISPTTCSANMFLNHPEAVIKIRMELAHLMAKNNKQFANQMLNKMNERGILQLAKTAANLLKGYPVYTVKLQR